MGFFARPRLSNDQFVQHVDDVLTLTGQTQIATTTGLTLIGDAGYIPIQATGALNDYVLTYDDSGPTPVIKLKESSASGGTGTYPYDECSTCTVGGLDEGSYLYNEAVVDILHDILVPNVEPIVVNPTISSFSLCEGLVSTPVNTVYEVGDILCNLCGNVFFNLGCINPLYDSGGTAPVTRSTCVSGYTFTMNSASQGFECSNITSCDWCYGSPVVAPLNNGYGVDVYYCGGPQPYYSDCTTCFDTALPNGFSGTSDTITGIYPWYWGKISCPIPIGTGRPDSDCIKKDITGGTATKVVGYSNSTLNVTFGSTGTDYIWFAIPSCGGVEKTCWYVCDLNTQAITGPVSAGGCLFPAYNVSTDLITDVTSADGCWSGEDYEVYVSNYQSAASVNMQIRNF